MSTPRTEGRLKSFRLSDVDPDLRLRAARNILLGRASNDDLAPEDRLLSLLRSNVEAGVDTSDRDGLYKVAREPSNEVYWISMRAWENVMGRAS